MPRIVRVPFLIPSWVAAQVLIPGLIFVKRGVPLSRRLIAHEIAHDDQWRRYGLAFPLVYVWEWIRAGFSYTRNRLEVEARNLERDQAYLNRAWIVIEQHKSRGSP